MTLKEAVPCILFINCVWEAWLYGKVQEILDRTLKNNHWGATQASILSGNCMYSFKLTHTCTCTICRIVWKLPGGFMLIMFIRCIYHYMQNNFNSQTRKSLTQFLKLSCGWDYLFYGVDKRFVIGRLSLLQN